MGTTTMMPEVALTAIDELTHIKILTETKLTEQSSCKKELEAYLPDYKMFHSCKDIRKTDRQAHKERTAREGAAGITLPVHCSLLTQKTVNPKRIDNQAAKGHCKAVSITPPGSDSLIIWGVYIPHDQKERDKVYEMLKL